ncbi:redoxin domain-containing protein [Schlesneria paludicola]|uniref:redoxin domain-containing protein n=1 Tax=Schlesneria paludicola TaxID=360056 RepID=UPI00029B2CB1|nr:redoxin domain-containing protein [Schlesneria paludicola]
MRFLSTMLFAFLNVIAISVAVGADPTAIGRKIGDFKLHDFLGAEHDSADLKDGQFVVVAFLGTECPLAKHYGLRLGELAKRYDGRKVAFVAIDANQQDTLIEMAQYARVAKIEFPFLKDPRNAVADQFAARRTPEIFVLDPQRVVRYHGRVDDQYGVGFSRSQPQREDLVLALDELLSGKDASTPSTPVTGCHIGRARQIAPRGEITYTKHIAPLIQTHCIHCHRAGEIGPFELSCYDDVVNWSSTIREVIEDRRMPPWHADSHAGTFANDRRLPEEDKQRLFAWIDNGMPEGAASDLPAARQFADGWQITQPDLVLSMSEAFSVPAKGTVEYQLFPINVTFEKDMWIAESEARPGNRAVVHHLILFYTPPGFEHPAEAAALQNSIATFAPGMPVWRAASGTARRIPAGSKLYLQAHYTPNGAPATDLSRIGLVFADRKQVDKQLLTDAIINPHLRIPPNTDNVLIKAEHTFRRDMHLISLMPHMHLRGKAFRIESLAPNGERTMLLDVPRYDFNWQNIYSFSKPLTLPAGTKLVCSAWYNNTDKNPSNPDSSQTVEWGDQTWEEMLVAQIETVIADQHLLQGPPQIKSIGTDDYEVTFSYQPTSAAKTVAVVGTFNDWKPTEHPMTGPDATGRYSTTIRLKPGRHEYKFMIDGKILQNDPGNLQIVGRKENNLLRIPEDVAQK